MGNRLSLDLFQVAISIFRAKKITSPLVSIKSAYPFPPHNLITVDKHCANKPMRTKDIMGNNGKCTELYRTVIKNIVFILFFIVQEHTFCMCAYFYFYFRTRTSFVLSPVWLTWPSLSLIFRTWTPSSPTCLTAPMQRRKHHWSVQHPHRPDTILIWNWNCSIFHFVFIPNIFTIFTTPNLPSDSSFKMATSVGFSPATSFYGYCHHTSKLVLEVTVR